MLSIDDIKTKKAIAEDYFRNMVTKFAEKREYGLLKYEIAIPSGVVPHKDITPATKIDGGSSQIVVDEPRFEIAMPSEPTQVATRRRDIQLKFARYLYRHCQRHNLIPPVGACAINLCMYGAFGLELIWDEEAFKRGKFCMNVEAVDPSIVRPMPDGSYFKIYRQRVIDVVQTIERMNAGKSKKIASWNRGNSKDNTEVEWTEYIDNECRAMFCNNTPILVGEVMPNIFGDTLMDFRYSGWAGTSPTGKPEELARGINDMCFDSYQVTSYFISMMIAGVTLDILGRTGIRRGAKVDTPSEIQQPWVMDNPEDTWEIPHSRMNPEAYEMNAVIRSQIDEQTFQGSLRGVRSAGSGTHEGLLIGQDLKRFRKPITQLELGIESIWKKAFKLVEKFGPVVIQGTETIKKEDAQGPINLENSLEPIDPARQEAKIAMLAKQVVAGLMPWETYATESGLIDDLTAARKLMLVDKIMNLPSVIEVLGIAAVKEWGIAEQRAILGEERRKTGQGALPEREVTPGRPGVTQEQIANLEAGASAGFDMRESEGVMP